MGSRLRIFMDDTARHTKSTALERQAKAKMKKAKIEEGHFSNLAHNKVLIQKKNGKPTKVLTGSMNFTIRGIYVQSNNILIFDNPEIADLYEQAFQKAFSDQHNFRKSDIASKWHETKINETTGVSFSFAPHSSSKEPFPLKTVADAINSPDCSSVMFSMMETASSGVAMKPLRT